MLLYFYEKRRLMFSTKAIMKFSGNKLQRSESKIDLENLQLYIGLFCQLNESIHLSKNQLFMIF